jgi:hypothetical protein
MKATASKEQVVEHLAELAMQLGGKRLADFGAARSSHEFTQRQLISCLILRAYLGTTYLGVHRQTLARLYATRLVPLTIAGDANRCWRWDIPWADHANAPVF